MNLTLPEGMKTLKPGDRLEIPTEKAKKLFREAGPRKVRIPHDSANIHRGVWIEFFSPLWGMCTARIQAVTVDGCIITDHSVLKGEGEPVTIPSSWLCGVYREQEAS